MGAILPQRVRSTRLRVTTAALLVFAAVLACGMLATYVATRVMPGPHTLAVSLGALSAVLLALVAWSTWQAVGLALRPVDLVATAIDDITASDLGDLGRRVPQDGGGDEIARLVAVVNRTLDRLECAIEQERRFASDASHELRTPLTGMRARIEVALADPSDSDPWQTLREALMDSERLHEIMNDLTMLSRPGVKPCDVEEYVDLAELARTAAERLSPTRVPVCFELTPGVGTRGDAQRLSRLMLNLLSNATRHATSRVTVTVTSCDRRAVVEVLDDGPGIPARDRELVFQRFTRLDTDTSRSREAGGTGLGLSIARDIAVAHHGRLTIEDSPTGAAPASC
ncbi:sensor histidine kinase [Thermocatellispora tengchongensis]|uniref:sensor histidine kinase n=1 Tax=Thermocatellispora tengchongensis TaxID=1073253 RepID=UPI00363CB9E3